MLEGRRAQAAEGLRAAESLFMKTKDRPGVARVLQNLLTLYRELGRPQEAVETGHKAVTVLEELNDRALAAMVYRDTADLYLRELHQPAQAAQGYRIALTYARLERLTEVPEIQAGLEACQGGPRSVRQRVETAAKQDAIVVEVLAGVPGWDRFDSTDALRDELRKRADAGEDNDPDAAVALWRAVAALSWEMDDQNWLAGALNEAGMICHRSGELETAQWYYQEAGKAARSVHDWNQLGMCRYNLGSLLAERGERDAALAALKESEESAHRMGDGMKLRKIKELETRIRPTST
jgi:tetratricopeptide (TPR) repeat protein